MALAQLLTGLMAKKTAYEDDYFARSSLTAHQAVPHQRYEELGQMLSSPEADSWMTRAIRKTLN